MSGKLFVFTKNGKRMHAVTPSLAEHWQKHGAKLKGVFIFDDIDPYVIPCGAQERR